MYFEHRETARVVSCELLGRKAADSVGTLYPEARIVSYGLGYAVQYRRSGPYYPELEAAPDLHIMAGVVRL